jgi:putative FmdB family regulatory protein
LEGLALPLYEYKCVKCGHLFEKIENVSAHMTRKCPKCGSKAKRQFAAPAIQFKGSGWYATDYASKSSGTASSEGSGDGAPAKTPEKTAEAKPAATDKVDKVSDRKKK